VSLSGFFCVYQLRGAGYIYVGVEVWLCIYSIYSISGYCMSTVLVIVIVSRFLMNAVTVLIMCADFRE
jgi:hypothetical protein